MTIPSTPSDIDSQAQHQRQRGGLTPNLTSSDPYAVLGLQRGATPHEVKRAYFALVREHSPEEHPDTFKLIRAAYEKLRTADAKAATDLFLFQPPTPWEPRKRQRKLDLDFHAEDIWRLLQQHGDLGQTNFKKDYRPIQV